MYQDILVPTDGSEGIKEVLPHALKLAEDNDATVHALYVIDRRLYLTAEDDVQDDIRQNLETEGDDALEEIRGEMAANEIPVTASVSDGIPYREILEYIEANNVDVVVMGTHGRTGRDRLANLGSVTDRVLKNANIPVFVIDIGTGTD